MMLYSEGNHQWRHLNTMSGAITLLYILCFFKAQLHRHNNKPNLKNKVYLVFGTMSNSYLTMSKGFVL
jgi:hypothetical protein